MKPATAVCGKRWSLAAYVTGEYPHIDEIVWEPVFDAVRPTFQSVYTEIKQEAHR